MQKGVGHDGVMVPMFGENETLCRRACIFLKSNADWVLKVESWKNYSYARSDCTARLLSTVQAVSAVIKATVVRERQ